ncbi:uncharacterized protein CBL_06039 [Carabus blaptoides fortunei]
MNISKMKVSDLKRELRARGLNASGNKTELVERLTEAIQNGKNDDGSADSVDELIDDDDVLNDDEIEQEVGNMKSIESEVSDKSFETDSTTHNKSTKRKSFEVTNNNGTSEAKPAKKIVLNRTSSAEAHPEEHTDTTLVPTITTTTPVATDVETSAVTIDSEAEKKVIKLSELNAKQRLEMRAKKFGVALSPDAKKEVRAQRFGPNSTATSAAAAGRTTITMNNSPTTGGPNMDLLKRRAERFGTVSTQLIKVETQEKLEKRKARFGEAATPAATNGETSEVQKAKRLERFKTSVK